MFKKTSMVAAVVLAATAHAHAKDLTGAEIKSTLSGNSITASDEVQYFSPDGTTIYKTGGKRTTGHWMVEGDEYWSDMSGAKKCYPVTGAKGSVSFIIGGKAYKYKVTKGQKVE